MVESYTRCRGGFLSDQMTSLRCSVPGAALVTSFILAGTAPKFTQPAVYILVLLLAFRGYFYHNIGFLSPSNSRNCSIQNKMLSYPCFFVLFLRLCGLCNFS
ncbi:hypothetical protein CPB84DRAFT_1781962 [Gymnopilus junonius]|uniref:Uncharacterized protein n=1 Tax=Gymnopilus junonius TaxID=109634 RepID=A0A9P5NLJ1_GYMJU|nr:hypothetical protein CPB84DRAFT_1781962 [Gymnopilus junonius]